MLLKTGQGIATKASRDSEEILPFHRYWWGGRSANSWVGKCQEADNSCLPNHYFTLVTRPIRLWDVNNKKAEHIPSWGPGELLCSLLLSMSVSLYNFNTTITIKYILLMQSANSMQRYSIKFMNPTRTCQTLITSLKTHTKIFCFLQLLIYHFLCTSIRSYDRQGCQWWRIR